MLKFKVGYCTYVGTIQRFTHNGMWLLINTGSEYFLSRITSLDKTILEIIIPVYVEEPEKTASKYRNSPPADDVFYGWIIYIAVMLIGAIFKERLMIWVFASAVFFLWKKGFLNGGKK